MQHPSPSAGSTGPVSPPAARRRRNLWLGLGIGALAVLFYTTIIVKTGWLGLPPGFR